MEAVWLVITAGLAIFWAAGTVVIIRGMAGLPRIWKSESAAHADCPPVSILMAARDEGEQVQDSVRSMLGQEYPQLQVIVADDRSTDGTGEILDELAGRDARLKVVHIRELPRGWLGKTHALANAYEHARGKWLVFADADVRFAPDLLRRSVGLAQGRGWDHLTFVWSSETVGFWEKTAFIFWLLSTIVWLQPWNASEPRSRYYWGAGVFHLIRREAYDASGTHCRLALEVLDDIKLGKIVKQAGFRSGVALSGDSVRIRWQRGMRGIVQGMTKNAFAGLNYRLSGLAVGLAGIIGLWLSPFLLLLLLNGTPQMLSAMAAGCMLVLNGYVAQLCGISRLYGLTLPLGVLILTYTLLRSAAVTLWRGGISWRDTFYSLEELRKGLV